MANENNNNSKISVREWRLGLTKDVKDLTRITNENSKKLIKVDLNLNNHLKYHEKIEKETSKATAIKKDFQNKLDIMRRNHKFQLILAVLAPILGGFVTWLIISGMGG